MDVGCGTGQTTNALMKRFKRVVGIDPAQSMLDQAVQGPEYKVGKFEVNPLYNWLTRYYVEDKRVALFCIRITFS